MAFRSYLLVAEDDSGLAGLYELWLRADGHDVRRAGDGVEALEIVAAEGLPLAALLDVEMPRLDGLAVCRTLRGLDAGMPILVVTGRDDLVEDAAAAGADRLLAKPAEPQALRDALDVLLGGVRRQPPATAA